MIQVLIEDFDRHAGKLLKLLERSEGGHPPHPAVKHYTALVLYRMGRPPKQIADRIGITPPSSFEEARNYNKNWNNQLRAVIEHGVEIEKERFPRASPVRLLLLSQRLMVERESPKRSWTSFLGMPRSMAASAFNLRSFEYAFMRDTLARVRYLRKPLSELRHHKLPRIPLPRTAVNTASWSGIIVPIRTKERRTEMAEHKRVPNLQELDEKEAYSFLSDVFFYGPVPDPEVVYEANHPDDYRMEMPQSGERIRGRENMRRFHKAYPGSPTIRVRRVLVREGLWVVEGVNDYGGGRVSDFVMILEIKDGRIWRDRRYYAEPFEAPEWRAQWVERVKF